VTDVLSGRRDPRHALLIFAAMAAHDVVCTHLTTCQWCGATWEFDEGYECRWCAEALERMRDDQRQRLLWPDWAADPGDRYDELSAVDKAVWDRTRGIIRGEGSVAVWTQRLMAAADAGIVTRSDATAALDRIERRCQTKPSAMPAPI
jgi:hypothetical protein